MNLNPELQIAFEDSVKKSVQESYEIYGVENLVLALLNTSSVKASLKRLGLTTENMITEIQSYLDKQADQLRTSKDKTRLNQNLSIGVQRMLSGAWAHAISSGKKQIGPLDLLATLYLEVDSYSLFLLKDKYSISKIQFLADISHKDQSGDSVTPRHDEQEELDPISKFIVDLSDADSQSHLVDFIARDYLLKRLVQICSRKNRNNPLIVGDNGVGKTALMLGFAFKGLNGNIPKNLKSHSFFQLKASSVVAGVKYKGELEERLQYVQSWLSSQTPCFLLVDDIGILLNTNSQQSGESDTAHSIRPLLENPEIQVIASCSHKDYKNIFDKTNYLARFFQKIQIEEANKEETKEIIKTELKNLQDFHQLTVSEDTVEPAIDLAKRYLTKTKLPDSPLDLIDESLAQLKLKDKGGSVLGTEDLQRVIADMSGIPTENLKSSTGDKLKTLEQDLSTKIFGQKTAVKELVNAVKFSFAGLSRETKPIGSYLFAGPTGVGKTELAIQLAKLLGNHFEKFDMSEYLEKHSVSRLVGAPPGYVGYEEGGLLTEAISKNPYSVILLDEIEKAHPDLINILLQIMDSGSLTDSNGKTVDCRNIILILTSNAGSKDHSKQSIGIQKVNHNQFNKEELKRFFAPEFLNSLDTIIACESLSIETLISVADKFMQELVAQLSKKDISIDYSREVLEYLVNKSYDPQYGARPIYRCLNDEIKSKLVDEVLFGKLANAGSLKISIKNKGLDFEFFKQ
ncbi:MAG: AAA family ATPase [Bdellovibrionales bacterium]